METIKLTEEDIYPYLQNLMTQITTTLDIDVGVTTIAGVPRGGIPVAYRVAGILGLVIVDDIREADIVVDDIVCSGKTKKRVISTMKMESHFFTLIDACQESSCKWYIFPWEESLTSSAEDIPVRLLEFIGEDIKRDGLKDTPKRFLKAWQFFSSGYNMNPKDVLGTVFENDEKYNEMVVLKDIEFYSMCEHHMIPFFGKVHIAYVPQNKVVGISKLARLVDCFSRRLQIQEKMTQQIANAIAGNLKPLGVAVVVEAKHLCMVSRGVEKQNSVMVTSALKGCLEEGEARAEFLALVGK